jgi:hypothetical protein
MYIVVHRNGAIVAHCDGTVVMQLVTGVENIFFALWKMGHSIFHPDDPGSNQSCMYSGWKVLIFLI